MILCQRVWENTDQMPLVGGWGEGRADNGIMVLAIEAAQPDGEGRGLSCSLKSSQEDIRGKGGSSLRFGLNSGPKELGLGPEAPTQLHSQPLVWSQMF